MMDIKIKKKENETTITLAGRLDTTTAGELSDAIDGVKDETKNLTIDMKAVDYITSVGIRVLLKTEMMFRRMGEFKIINVNDEIQYTMQMVGLGSLVKEAASEVVTEKENEIFYLESHVLSSEEKKTLPKQLLPIISKENAKILELINEDEDLLAIVFLFVYESDDIISVEHIQIMDKNEKKILSTLFTKLSEYGEIHDAKSLRYFFEDNQTLSGCVAELSSKHNLVDKGINRVCMEYSMASIKASPIYQKRDQLEKMMDKVKTLNSLSKVALFDLNLADNINIDESDPVFCRFFVVDDSIVGELYGTEVDNNKVVINHLKTKKGSGTEYALPLMLSSFITAFTQMMENDAILILDLDDMSLLKGIETSLGKPDHITNFRGFEFKE